MDIRCSRRHSRAIVLAGCILLGACREESVPERAAVGATSLNLAEEVRIGEVDGPGTISDQNTLTRTPDGRYLVVSNYEPGVIKVFGPDGRYMQTIGRQGEGPGEYRVPSMIHAEAGQWTVFDPPAVRATRLDSALEPLLTRRLPFRSAAVVPLNASRYVLISERRIGTFPFHVFDWESGTVVATVAPGAGSPLSRSNYFAVARADDHSFWAAATDHYHIERRDASTGEVLQVIQREVEWFPPGVAYGGPIYEVPPPTRLNDLVQDEQGRLWVLLTTASSRWSPLTPSRAPTNETYVSDGQMNQLYDTIVEVLHSATGDIIVTERFPGYMARFVGPGRIWQNVADDVGNPSLIVYRLDLPQ